MSVDRSLSVDVQVARGVGVAQVAAAIEVPPGVTVLFGPSGAGKSTLLACIAGLLRPDCGRIASGADIWFDAERRIDVPVHERRIAFVFQTLALFPHMNAIENVAYGIPRSLPREERRARAAASLSRFRASHLESRRPGTFSGGEAQRVALARAFAMSPRLVLLDEPFSAMDRDLRQELVALVPLLASELGVPVLHVTHHRREARTIGERVILLEAGAVKAVGPVAELVPRDLDEETAAR